MFACVNVESVNDLDRVQSYVEDQFIKAFVAVEAVQDARELERMAFHVGSMLLTSTCASISKAGRGELMGDTRTILWSRYHGLAPSGIANG